MFDYTREHENDFSFWYPKIKDCGIPTPLTFYTKLPSAEEEPEYVKRLYEAFYMEHPKEDEETVKAYGWTARNWNRTKSTVRQPCVRKCSASSRADRSRSTRTLPSTGWVIRIVPTAEKT